MGVVVQLDLIALGLQRLQGLHGNDLGPVHLAGLEGRQAGRRVGDGLEDQCLDLRHVPPVVLVPLHDELLARDLADKPEGTGAYGGVGKAVALLLHRLHGGNHDIGQIVDQIGVVVLHSVNGDRVVVHLGIGFDIGQEAAHRCGAGGAVVLKVRIHHAVQSKDHTVRIEIRSVVELDSLPQMERPPLGVFRVLLPGGGQAWDNLAGLSFRARIPLHQGVIELEADEAVTLLPLRGLGIGIRQGRAGHRNPQSAAVAGTVHTGTAAGGRGLLIRIAAGDTARQQGCRQRERQESFHVFHVLIYLQTLLNSYDTPSYGAH